MDRLWDCEDFWRISVLRFSIRRCLQSSLRTIQLDDGWPESVEEQSLLLLVWRHYITRQYIKDVLKADEKNSIKTIYHKHKTIVCIVNFV
jgi:hypothetical protein